MKNLIDMIVKDIEEISLRDHNAVISLIGDFNMLVTEKILKDAGMSQLVTSPTHGKIF